MNSLERWVVAVESGEAESVAGLYEEDAVLHGTLSSRFREGRADIAEYFRHLTTKENLRVTIVRLRSRELGEVRIDSGLYDFTFRERGEAVTLPARFTFVYRRVGGTWRIVEHHSSLVPGPTL